MLESPQHMKNALYSLLVMAGLLAAPAVSEAYEPAPGHVVYEGNMFGPGESGPEFKKTLNDKYGTQFIFDLVWTAVLSSGGRC